MNAGTLTEAQTPIRRCDLIRHLGDINGNSNDTGRDSDLSDIEVESRSSSDGLSVKLSMGTWSIEDRHGGGVVFEPQCLEDLLFMMRMLKILSRDEVLQRMLEIEQTLKEVPEGRAGELGPVIRSGLFDRTRKWGFDERWSLYHDVCQQNDWLREDHDPDDHVYDVKDYPYEVYECSDVERLVDLLRHGNLSIRTGLAWRNLLFVQQVDGGDEWLTLRWSDGYLWRIDSCSFLRSTREMIKETIASLAVSKYRRG